MNWLESEQRERLQSEQKDWEAKEVATFLKKQPERKEQFHTIGDFPVKRTYTAADIADTPLEDIGLPGRYPFTRGPYPTMYRSRTWTMRQIAGFGTGEDTNLRFKYLIEQGQTGISTDFDMPTLMGYDSDHPMSDGEVGRMGVSIDTLADMEALLADIDLEKISVSMTINPSAWILLAMYVALGQKRGYDLNKLSGTVQADILKEYIAQKEYIYPIAPSVRIVRDIITYSAKNLKRYNPINISGYHISEAGSSPLQEAAFTLANLVTYVEEVTKTGMHVDEFAPRLAFFFVSQGDFFEEVAKFRALRRCYAKIMKERFGAKNPESMRLRFHCQTAAATLTKPQYMINIIRTSVQALSAVLGGAQSLHTNGYDEALALPTAEAATLALRTQQIVAYESGVAQTVDPLAGSYYVESLTDEVERRALDLLGKVEELGGSSAAIDARFFQEEIGRSAYEFQLAVENGSTVLVGVNKFADGEDPPIIPAPNFAALEQGQRERLAAVKATRDAQAVTRALAAIREAAPAYAQASPVGGAAPVARTPLMPLIVDAVKARATVGEISDVLRDVWGEYRPS